MEVQVPRQVCKDMTSTSCKPVTTTNCVDVVEKVPRQQGKEVCVDKPEEKCTDEKVTITTHRKEKECKQVLVETCTTTRNI